MRIYISGPIEGENNYIERFAAAEEELYRQGCEICNPIDARKPCEGKSVVEACAKLLADCDAIYMLDGWKRSTVSRLEFAYAVDHKMPVYFEGGKV